MPYRMGRMAKTLPEAELRQTPPEHDDPLRRDDPNRAPDPFLDDLERPIGTYIAIGIGGFVLIVLMVALIGILVVNPKGPSTKAVQSRAASDQLATRLLTPLGVGTGWSMFGSANDSAVGDDSFGGPSSIVPGCLSAAVDSQRTAEAQEQLIQGDAPPPVLNEALETFPAPASAQAAMTAIQGELNNCHHVVFGAGAGGAAGSNQTANVTIVTNTPPKIGDQASAWTIDIRSGAVSTSTVVVAVRQAGTLVMISYGTNGLGDMAGAEHYATMALAAA